MTAYAHPTPAPIPNRKRCKIRHSARTPARCRLARGHVRLALDALADGQVDGQHHLRWVIDQAVRILTGDGYEAWVTEYRDGKDGPETYVWDRGIAP